MIHLRRRAVMLYKRENLNEKEGQTDSTNSTERTKGSTR